MFAAVSHKVARVDAHLVAFGIADGGRDHACHHGLHDFRDAGDDFINIGIVAVDVADTIVAFADSGRWKHMDVSVFIEFGSLVGGHLDVLVVGEDKDVLRVDAGKGVQEVLCRWVHGLTTSNHFIRANLVEGLDEPAT